MTSKNTGFTLIELIIVLIIVGIISSIAAPMMSDISSKAMKAEAITALGTIRTAQRMYYMEYNNYARVSDFSDPTNQLSKYIQPGALNGVYFSERAYGASSINSAVLATALAGFSITVDLDDLRLIIDNYNSMNVSGCNAAYTGNSPKVQAFKNIYMLGEGTVFESDGTIPF